MISELPCRRKKRRRDKMRGLWVAGKPQGRFLGPQWFWIFGTSAAASVVVDCGASGAFCGTFGPFRPPGEPRVRVLEEEKP
jgi:hypothetical protein